MASNRDDPLTFINPSSSPVTVSSAEGDSFLLDPPSQIGSASGSFQNEGLLSGGDGPSDAEFGFSRPDFRQSLLSGTVQFYERHVFLCYKHPQVWPPRIEAAEFDRLPRLLSAALLVRKGEMKKQTRLTICEGHDGTETSNGDVLIFPDMIRYRSNYNFCSNLSWMLFYFVPHLMLIMFLVKKCRRLTHFDVDTFVEEVLVKDGEWQPVTPEKLKGSYIFVCSHGSRDRRCGVCGPAIVARFKEEIELHGLQGKVSVSPCSHIGGHEYAGNVIIFGSNIDGKVSGHWYGYVTPDDVPILLEQHIEKGEIVDGLWRGEMGLSEEEQKKSKEVRLQQNGGTDDGKPTKETLQTQTNEMDNAACGSQMEINACCQDNRNSSCCQENRHSSCCQNPVLSRKTEKVDAYEREAEVTPEKKKSSKKTISRCSSNKGASIRKVCAMPTWFESWEREDTYAALAVVCAAVSVAVACHCYRQLA